MKLIDISWPIKIGMTEYRDKKSVRFSSVATFEKDGVRLTDICLNNHTGTHIDAPSHFLKEGKSIDGYALEQFVGPCLVLDLTSITKKVTVDDLIEYDIQSGDILLFKTKNSQLAADAPFNAQFIFVDESAAQFLAKKNIKAVGLDYPGFEYNQPNHPSHTVLLKKNIPIIEGLRLAHVQEGEYFLWCLPLKVEGIDGAPARAVLWEMDEEPIF
ncbi:MAG: cyclase family protein [Candidatus Babeliales bacterium]